MDLLDSLCNPNKPFTRIKIEGPQVTGFVAKKNDSDEEMSSDDEFDRNTANYAEEYQNKEIEKYQQKLQLQEEMMKLETNTNYSSMEQDVQLSKHVYEKFPFDKYLRTEKLVIDFYKNEIINLIRTNSVLIIEGPTGCGKSTQVPQFILDDCKANNEYCNIVVTQPRRIAAISLARRVCDERGWSVGDVCGYQVGLEKEANENTVLTYATTGVLLNKVIAMKNLFEYTHVIVDEIHERTEEMDFLLLLLRKFLYMHSLDIKIILMSATFDTNKFSQYFRNNSGLGFEINAPAICIKQQNKYNTKVFYIDQLNSLGKVPTFNIDEPKIDDSLYEHLVLLITAFDKLDMGSKNWGSVLVFLPGIMEIEEAYNHLKKTALKRSIDWYILPLHSSITTDEQRKVFYPAPANKRKIILSTNIAESSITVNDIVYVIDFCLTKQMVVDPYTQYESLKLQWASHNNCTQRAGRAGRVCDGRIYRLVSSGFFSNQMTKESIPTILRCPLDRIVLFSKLLELNEPPKAILALLVDPPNLANIESTIWKLKECGALLSTCNGLKMISDGDLTIMGKIMARLPIDVHLSKLIVLGHIFSCLEECIIMAAGCALSNVFALPFQAHLKAYTNKLMWADGSCSDLITYYNLYKVWDRNKRLNTYNKRDEYEWAKLNYINLRCLREWSLLVKEMKERLQKLGIKESPGANRVNLSQTEIPLVLKVVIAGAFYPNYFKRTRDNNQLNEREAVKEVGGRDPFTTVYFRNMDSRHPGFLYSKRIKEALSDIANNMQITFESGKVFVQFQQVAQYETVNIDGHQFISSIPGKICMEVYRAIRRRQLKIPTNLLVLSINEGWKRANNLGLSSENVANKKISAQCHSVLNGMEGPVLPTSDVEYIKIQISSRIDVGHFWAQNDDEQTLANLTFIERNLNTKDLKSIEGKVTVGELYAGFYDKFGMYYRCRIICVSNIGKNKTIMAQVLFIDYGDTDTVAIEKIKEIPSDELKAKPPQAMECVLCGIQPSLVLNPRAIWSEVVNKMFMSVTDNCTLYGKVYSVVNGIVHLELFKEYPQYSQHKNMSLNEWLIEKGYAVSAEESYLSKVNHEKRMQIQTEGYSYNSNAAMSAEDDVLQLNINDIQPPNIDDCKYVINLKGPFSPLEMNIYSCTGMGAGKCVRIDPVSVNSALLDSNPGDNFDRLIVAGHINQNANNSALSLRHTTIMPNIPGFPMLMSLLFCPTMQPKLSEDGTSIAALLFGLGTYGDSRKSVYPAHDMLLLLDTELDTEDLVSINELRYWMNVSVSVMESIHDNSPPIKEVCVCQAEIKNILFKMLKKKRKIIEKNSVEYAEIWNKFKYEGKILYPEGVNLMDKYIWPLHWTMELNHGTQKEEITKNLSTMQDMATKTIPMTEITCKLCNVIIYNVFDMRIHLSSETHLKQSRKNS